MVNAPSQQEMRACLSQENMRSQISDHLMADRCYFTLTEKASVNKQQMSSNTESMPWIPRLYLSNHSLQRHADLRWSMYI